MNLRKNSKFWETLASVSETPGEFLKAVMAIKGLTASDVSRILGTTPEYISIVIHKNVFGATACINIAKALDLNPYLLGRLSSDYQIKKHLEKDEVKRGELHS